MPYVIGRPSKFLALAVTMAGMLIAVQPAAASPLGPPPPLGPGQLLGPGQPLGPGHRVAPPLPLAPPAPAGPNSSCPQVPSSALLRAFGDSANYSPLIGGNFDGPTPGWTLDNASVANDPEPFAIPGVPGRRSLLIGRGGSATSPAFCLDNGFPSFRFFADFVGGNHHGTLTVSEQWVDAEGNSGSTPIDTLNRTDYGSWTLTPSLPLGSALAEGQTVSAQLVFTASRHSSWEIDDILLDPYAK